MKTKIAFVLFGFVAARIFAGEAPQGQLSVAVYDFKGDAKAEDYGSKVAALITADLATDTNLVMLERTQLNKALHEQAFGISGMVSSDAAAKIGQMTGVKVLVSGQVITLKQNRLVIIANIIGTETGRLFAAKVEGAGDNLMELTSALSSNIAQTISVQSANLLAATEETHTQRLNHIVADIKGTNRPSISIAITFYGEKGGRWHDNWAEYEFSAVLLKAGFKVMDEHSDVKADIEIIGDASGNEGPPHGDLTSAHTAIELKIRERRTGRILAFDHQESTATAAGKGIASRLSHINCADGLAERILPLLAN